MSPALPSRTARPAARAAALALVLGLGLSGCGAGLRAQTYQERATSDATNEAVGAIAVRNLRVLPPSGGESYAVGSTARVAFVLVNEGPEADRLTDVTTDAAGGVALVGPAPQLTVPAQGTVSDYAFELRGLTRELRPGQYVQMTLTFADNGSETMLVPVEVTGTPQPRREGYKVGETDSSGQVIVEDEPGAGTTEEGSSDRPELDTDGNDPAAGDAQPDTQSDPIGDENGGADAASPPPEG